ncbi:MAG: hypothetical protein NW200_01365 [Hyphomonadaceae bacterium]|nr:hypothetical protein [Hyphomonadaceae bacterium]
MALKLALPTLDKRRMALARARFHAWWHGAAFDEEAARAAIEAAANDAGVESELFAPPAPPEDPRLDALQRIWGAGRLGPGDAADEAALPARLNLSATATLGLFGPGLAAPALAMAQTHLGEVRVFEWREETLALLRHGLAALDKRVSVAGVDLETFSAPAEAFDGAVSIDDFVYADNAQRMALQIARGLKDKASALVETYCAAPGPDLAAAFASAFREPQVRMRKDIATILEECGLRVDADEDVTDAHVEHARAAFKTLGDSLRGADPLSPVAARELAWETEAWRARVRLLASRRLERRRFLVTKR